MEISTLATIWPDSVSGRFIIYNYQSEGIPVTDYQTSLAAMPAGGLTVLAGLLLVVVVVRNRNKQKTRLTPSRAPHSTVAFLRTHGDDSMGLGVQAT